MTLVLRVLDPEFAMVMSVATALVAIWRALFAVLAVAVLALAIVGVIQVASWFSGPPEPSSTTVAVASQNDDGEDGEEGGGGDADALPSRLVDLIEPMADTRESVRVAIGDVKRCGASEDLSAAADTFEEAAEAREAALRQLEGLSVDDEELAEVVDLLGDAMRTSAAADRHFADWARDVAHECRTDSATDSTDNRFYRSGQEAAGEAHQAKQAFVEAWNAATGDDDVPAYTSRDL